MIIEAMKQALEALEEAVNYTSAPAWSPSMTEECNEAIIILRTAIEAAEKQEPVAWVCYGASEKHDIDFQQDDIDALPVGTQLYTTPQPQPCPYIRSTREGTHHCALSQREWVGLTDEEMHECWDSPLTPLGMKHARMIEAKLKEKNT